MKKLLKLPLRIAALPLIAILLVFQLLIHSSNSNQSLIRVSAAWASFGNSMLKNTSRS